MGRLYESADAAAGHVRESSLPAWLQSALHDQLALAPEDIFSLSEQQGQGLLMEHWSSQHQD